MCKLVCIAFLTLSGCRIGSGSLQGSSMFLILTKTWFRMWFGLQNAKFDTETLTLWSSVVKSYHFPNFFLTIV
jgi:hypothetical protein